MTSLEVIISQNRPLISPSSLKTYNTVLKTLYYRHHEKGTPINLEWFNEIDIILKDIEGRPISTQKTILSALIAVKPDIQMYRERLMLKGSEYKEYISKQEKSRAQSDNWMEFNQVKKIFDTMFKHLKPILNTRGEICQHDFMRLQDLVLLAVTSGIFIPPRRSKDWTEFKIRSIDKETDNYMEKDSLVFNDYKTKKTYGRQTVALPKELKTIITKYITHNPYQYLFTKNDGSPISNIILTQRMNHIFGCKISTGMLRHIFLSDKMDAVPPLVDMQNTAKDMGHSVMEQLQYIKR